MKLGVVYGPAIFCSWVPALARLALGPSTNLAAIINPTTEFATFLSILFMVLVLCDFLLIALKSWNGNSASVIFPN